MRRFRESSQQQQQQRQSYYDGLPIVPTESESTVEDEDEDEVESDSESSSSGMGLAIPTGYRLPSPRDNHNHNHNHNNNGGRTSPNEQRLLMLAKHPNATEEAVAMSMLSRQQPKQQQQQRVVAFPVDSDTGEAWEQQQQQSRRLPPKRSRSNRHTTFAANLRSSSQNQDLDRVWQDPEAPEQQHPSEFQPSSFLSSLVPKFFYHSNNNNNNNNSDSRSECAGSKQSMSMSSEKTPKISNVNHKERARRIRRANGEFTPWERVQAGFQRLTSTKSGLVVLCLLIVLLLAMIVTIGAGLAASKKKQDDASHQSSSSSSSTQVPRIPMIPATTSSTPAPSSSSSSSSSSTDPPEESSSTLGFNTRTRTPTHNPTNYYRPTLRPTTSNPTPSPSVVPTTRDPTRAPTTQPPSDAPTTTTTTLVVVPSATPTQSPAAPSTLPTTQFMGTDFQSLGESLYGFQDAARFGYSVALSENGRILAVGAPYATTTTGNNNNNNNAAGMVQVYEWRNNNNNNHHHQNNWVTRGPAMIGRNAQDQLGSSMALSKDGSILVASEPTFSGQAGDRSGNVRAFVWSSDQNRYIPLGQDLEGQDATDHLGVSIALSGDGRRLAIGAPYHDNGNNNNNNNNAPQQQQEYAGSGSRRNVSGQVSVWEFSNDTWKALGTPLAGSNHLDWFGWEVDLSDDGSVLAVGAPRNLQYGGYVHCYRWNENDDTWQPLGNPIRNLIKPIRYDDSFGHTISLRQNHRIAIGAPGKNNANGAIIDAGQVTVYEFLDDTKDWSLLGNPIVSSSDDEVVGESGDQLGLSIDLQGDVLFVGTPGKNNHGQVDSYQYKDGVWERHPRSLQGLEGSNFGFSVHYTPVTQTLVVGSAVTSGANTGMVSVYQQI